MAYAYGFKCSHCGATLIGDWSFNPGPDCPICRKGSMAHDMDVKGGHLEPFAWPGGYTLIYALDGDSYHEGSVYCAKCAAQIRDMRDSGDKPLHVTCGTYDEGPDLECDECGKVLESSYGDPESDKGEE